MSAEQGQGDGVCWLRFRATPAPEALDRCREGTGGGWRRRELVEMCDIVVAAASARFCHPEITLAAMPGAAVRSGWRGSWASMSRWICCSPGAP